jgi:hypothetical protein
MLGLVLASAPAQAGQSVELTPSIGAMGRHFYFWTLGLSVDFYLTRNLTITPEFFMANKDLSFNVVNDEDMRNYRPTYFLLPGVMLNYHHLGFFGGAGVVYSNEARYDWHYEGGSVPRTVVWEVWWERVWNLKLNIGLKLSKIRITASFLHPFEDIGWFPRAVNKAFAATIGYTF